MPPPYHGTSVANDILLNSKLIRSNFEVKIVQLSKPKLQLGGKLSITALLADLGVTLKVLKELITFKPRLTYVGIAQTRMGLWRDAGWIRLATLWGSKALSHMHGGNFRNLFDNELDGVIQGFVKKTLARLQGIIVLDPSLAYLFKGLVADNRIFVLRNGIPASYSETQVTEANQRRASHEQLRVTYLSNLVPGKGFDIFLEAAALLKEQGLEEKFIFNLAGAAPTPEIGAQVQEFVKFHNLENAVRILGRIIGQGKDRLLIDSDVFVFPSQLSEGQPIVIIEALAAGLPVIATARGAIPAMVRDGVNGFIVPEGDPELIAERLRLLKADVPLRFSMGAASRKLFQEEYTAEKFVQGFANILNKVMGMN
ncbi:MAG: glycosyltransferase family 4 protein [Desulfobaccales bacterium]